MKLKIWMNNACRAKNIPEWKEGWSFKSSEKETFCHDCGYHTQGGWGICICGKKIYCGCIASGGVSCEKCLGSYSAPQGAESSCYPNISQQLSEPSPSKQMEGYKEDVNGHVSDGEIAAGSQQNDAPEGQNSGQVFPIFEKRLSKTDCSTPGRFCIPKASAEAYLPKLHGTKRLYNMKVVDTEGTVWPFEFRQCDNHDSPMYVFDGIIPYIQKMQLQAGDTVKFGRKFDPTAEYTIRYQKATNNVHPQDQPATPHPVSSSPAENSSSAVAVQRTTENAVRITGNTLPWPLKITKRKRSGYIRPVSTELNITDTEAQMCMRPSSTSKAIIVMVDRMQIEVHDEPPIFGYFPVDDCPPRPPIPVEEPPQRPPIPVEEPPQRSQIPDLNSPYLVPEEMNSDVDISNQEDNGMD